MKEIGELLKLTREEHAVSIEEAAEDLSLTVNQIENIESGNTRSFRDLYELKEMIINYAKYLGLDTSKVIDEYNDFLFEKTSKISLEDISEARNKAPSSEALVSSPYTKNYDKKIDFTSLAPFVFIFLVLVLIMLIIFLMIRIVDTKEEVTIELKKKEFNYYEYTY